MTKYKKVFTCKHCKKKFCKYKIHRAQKSTFCTRKCFYAHLTANAVGYIAPGGYRKIRSNGKDMFEHRVIMEKKLGRKLRKNEIVHHINGKTTDNRLSNLKIMTQKEHVHEHRFKHWDINLALAMIKQRKNFTEIGKALKVSGGSVYAYLRNHKLYKPNKNSLIRWDLKAATRWYKKGYNFIEIAQKINGNPYTLRSYFFAHGLHKPTRKWGVYKQR